ncbi:unnamed protein product, partial [Didymodactylos carnosus]
KNIGLTLIVVLLTGTLLVVICAFLLYKRRNDRRVKYLSHMLSSLFPSRSRTVLKDNVGSSGGNSDGGNENLNNNNDCKKLDDINGTIVPPVDEKSQKINEYDVSYNPIDYQHKNINEKHQSLEKRIFIDNLKTAPSFYASYKIVLTNDKKYEKNEKTNSNENMYSIDPVAFSSAPLNFRPGIHLNMNNSQNNDDNSILYEYVLPLDDTTVDNTSTSKIQLVRDSDDDYYSDIKHNDRHEQQQENYDQVIYATPSIKSTTIANNENESHI